MNNSKDINNKSLNKHLNKSLLSDAELMRYARQIILPAWDIPAQLRLVNSKVVMIGMGGLGCPASQTLARAGVGFMRLVDHDRIEASNLQRQNLFGSADVGSYKAQAAKTALAAHNEYIHLEVVTEKITPENIGSLIADADLVLDCTDNFEIRDTINTACFTQKKAFVSAAAIGMEGQLALYDFGKSEQPCYRCVFGSVASEEAARCSEIGVLASTTQVLGNLAAHAALNFLGLQKNVLQHKLLVWNGTNMQQRLFTYKKDPHCQLCGTA